MMNRATFSLLAAGATLTVPLRATADDAPVLRIGVVPSENFALALFAREQGFFKPIKANIEITTFAASAAITAGVIGGALDMGCSNWGSIANAYGRGLPIAVVSPGGVYTTASPTTELTVAKASPLQTAKDLSGKTVALSTLRDAQQACVMKWADVNGGDSRAIKFIELPPPDMGKAVAAGRVDAAAILEPSLSEALRTDVRVFAKPLDAVCTPQIVSAYYGTTAYLDKNVALVKAFIVAMKGAAAWANANHAGTAAILAKYSKLTAADISQTHRTSYTDVLDVAAIQPLIDVMYEYKVLPNKFSVTQTFWTQLS
jgi:NitT/TauT family transport system substrate-binding protein